MELNSVPGAQKDNYENISGNTLPPPWYRRRRNVVGIGVAVLLIILVIAVASAIRGEKKSQGIDAIPLLWDGDCPMETSECPESFQGRPPPLLLISLDGFKPNYMKRGFSPTLERISRCGATTDFMYPVFPTKTFPNHFSQVTGLYPSSHGIIDNHMFDPVSRKTFKLGSEVVYESFWWRKEPIWVSAEKQGKRTAAYFWPGSDVEINGTRPSFYKKYDTKVPYEDRVDQILRWLDLPRDIRPYFITLYLNEPDTSGHTYGVNSKEVNDALLKVEGVMERLFSGLQQRNLTGCVNVFIVSDHGMSDIDCSRVFDLHNYTDVFDSYPIVGAFGRLRPKKAGNASVDTLLEEFKCKSPHMRVYRKEELPVRYHYSNNPRIEPVIVDVDAGWTIVRKPDLRYCSGGTHGYDNLFPDMKAIFVAIGPSIKKNFTIEPFLNVELYELMCELIGINPNPNNGTRESLYPLLMEPGHLVPQLELDPPASGLVPKHSHEFQNRVEAAQCYCNQSLKQTDTAERSDFHLPFGVPQSNTNDTLRLLHNDDYVTTYDSVLLMPKWTSFTLMRNTTMTSEDICWTGDARVRSDETVRCTDYTSTIFQEQHIFQRPIFPPGFSEFRNREQASYVTNSVPKSLDHVTSLESEIILILENWSQEGEINILMGPVFDILATGVEPDTAQFKNEHDKYGRLLVPTHLFIVVTWCTTNREEIKDCDSSSLKAHSFLLPNHPYPQTCENATSVIRKNVARVIDVETIAGLSLFTRLPIYDAVRLRTMMPNRPLL